MRRRGLTSVASLAALATFATLASRPARACSISQTPVTIDPSLRKTDSTSPVLADVTVAAIKRGRAPQSAGCSGSSVSSSCDDLGEITLTVAATDDMTPADHLGYAFSLANGTLPAGLVLPAEPIQAQSAISLMLVWIDGATDDQDPFSFELRVVAIDAAGNESQPRVVVLQHQGPAGGSDCRVGGGAPPSGGSAAFVAASLGAIAARRRRRD